MGLRVLVVDDSPMFRIVIREMLEMLGHQVVGEADSGEGALEQFALHKPDLVTLDVSLPDTDGISVLRTLKQMYPDPKVILVTGNDQDKIIEQAKLLGALDFLAKPFRKDRIEKAVAKLLPPGTP